MGDLPTRITAEVSPQELGRFKATYHAPQPQVSYQEDKPSGEFSFEGQQGIILSPTGLGEVENSPLKGTDKISHFRTQDKAVT